jgi:carbamoylphosphate synthase small subunit
MDNALQKKTFIDAYGKTFGNITQSCKAADISRQTFYNWKENDSDFANEIETIEPAEQFVDFLESKLIQRVNDGDTTAIIFALKTKGKHRGYIEKTQVEHSGDQESPIIFKKADGRAVKP